MIYNINSLEKHSILNLFDFNYDNIDLFNNYKREELIALSCYFFTEFLNQKGVNDIKSTFYLLLDSYECDEVESFFKKMIFINKSLINKYNFSFLEGIQKDLHTISKFKTNKESDFIQNCEECNGEGFISSIEDECYNSVCMECGGSGQKELDSYNDYFLNNESINAIKKIEVNFKKEIKFITDSLVQIVLNENLHPKISSVYKSYETINNVKNF